MDISGRSVSSKLRKEGYSVEKVGAAPSSFSEDETDKLRDILENNPDEFTYAQLAEQLGSSHTARAVQGKVLSMELTGNVKATPAKEAPKTFTEDETATVISMTEAGNFLEEIAEAVGKTANQVRGKALSLLRAEQIAALPTQRDRKPEAADVFDGLDIGSLTVEQIVAETGKSERGVKTMLTRRGLTASDYDGAARAAKAKAKAD